MATSLAGPTLDIHGGGHDLIFPHHENEIAQAEAVTGAQFARYWLHNGFVELDREKMSKSLGNVVSLREVLKRFSPDALRLFFLSAHYRMPVSYGEERIAESEKAMKRFDTFFARIDELKRRAAAGAACGPMIEFGKSVEEAKRRFGAAMDDDFNTPNAVAELFTLMRNGNTVMAELERDGRLATAGDVAVLEETRGTILSLGRVLGLFGVSGGRARDDTVAELVELLLSIRRDARAKKDWALSDRIRDALIGMGFVIEDGVSGTTWRRK